MWRETVIGAPSQISPLWQPETVVAGAELAAYTGEPEKIAFSGRWIMPLPSVLKSFRGLRGGPLDLLGRTAERRSERAFISKVEGLLDQIAESTTESNWTNKREPRSSAASGM